MAYIKSPTLFFVTSPRTPYKMRPEIKLLVSAFSGQQWNANSTLQTSFMRKLASLPEFEGAYSHKNPELSARDRITRGPKALGLVNLSPISLTSAGAHFLDEDLSDEALLRQLLKFQLPSPFHKANPKTTRAFCIKPYLEILRLVYTLGRLAFDELSIYGMCLVDWHDFDKVVGQIRQFRIEKEKNKGHYKKFVSQEREKVVAEVFKQEIAEGQIKTRESAKVSLDNFIKTKAQNMRDYADACVRYLRATGLITVSNPGRTISIIESRRDEVVYILKTIDRDPVHITNEKAYKDYLFNAELPRLLTDDRAILEKKAYESRAVETLKEAQESDSASLKKAIKKAKEVQRQGAINAQITELKSFVKYDEVLAVFKAIKSKDVYDPPLAFEWNIWRAMTMMDGGTVKANLTFDDAGNPLSTAQGKTPDIVCDYGDFIVIVEVTLLSGNKQYDAEGEPVARHLGEIKTATGKTAYCFFVAPTINPSAISHFYMLHQTNIKHYGGKSVIIPISLERFVGMLTQAKDSGYIPEPRKIREFCEYSRQVAQSAADEEDWYAQISARADTWLS